MPHLTYRPGEWLRVCLALVFLVFCIPAIFAQQAWQLAPGPMVDGGRVALQSSQLTAEILEYSGTIATLSPRSERILDYTPGDRLIERSADTFYHLGDLDLQFREGTGAWRTLSTAYHREPAHIQTRTRTEFVTDVSSSLPVDSPLQVVRTWKVENGELLLRFTLTNRGEKPIELGGAGMALVFNNLLEGRTLDQVYHECSFYDPYIGEDAGYVQVVPLNGTGPVLLVLPDGRSPLEAWKPILDQRSKETHLGLLGNDPTPRGTTFEGSFDWMVHSASYAQTEWKGVEEWNPASSESVAPGASTSFGLRFVVAPSIRQVEATLTEHHRPVAIGIPGYVLPQDLDGRLFLRSAVPISSIASEPAGALNIRDDGPTPSGLHAYTIRSRDWGRSRLVIRYSDGTTQSIAYRTIKPERQIVNDLGHFLFHEQWFTDANDPFHRAPSVISYDNQAHRQLQQEPRVWIAGLSDEAGAGSWLAAAMKESISPDKEEIAKLEQFVDGVLWGRLQESTGEHKWGVHKSLFYYQPDALPGFPYDPTLDWHSWTSWNRAGAEDVGRSYNYPHVVAAYWSLYRIARNSSGLVTHHPWQWYLDQAYETTMAMRSQAPYYTQFGQMEGTVFVQLLDDLKREGWTEKATKLEAMMRERAELWRQESYPFGSEMPWDSTGQEEVYDWTRYFHFDDKAELTLNAVLAYTPVLPNWGYNGSARRYWDFLYGGKYQRIERQLHHYGSGLNAISLLAEYRLHPSDLYLLRAGYAGATAPLTNIDANGFGSVAFHSFPDRMSFDPYTGDYGPNFFGHTMNVGTYLVHDDAMGWLCFGGNFSERGGKLHVTVLDSARKRIFLAPLNLWITLDAGEFDSFDYDTRSGRVWVHLSPATENISQARLRIEQLGTERAVKTWKTVPTMTQDSGAFSVPLGERLTTLELTRF